jgi:acetylornithine deacetylase/succinyl-diaminopimelate desuccinylase-like protein
MHSRFFLLPAIFSTALLAQPATPDWNKLNDEALKHFQTLVRIDTQDPPGFEQPAVEYLKKVLEAEGIPVQIFALDPKRPNLVARLKGSGKKRPVLIMGHTDVVNIDPAKWIAHGPFSADRDGGYIYGRGTIDDKDNVTACLMIMLTLKRMNVPLDRDVIFLSESGEEGSVKYGIKYMVENHFDDIAAEYAFAEGGSGIRQNGKMKYVSVGTAEKIPYALKLVSHGVAGHGSRPLRSNAVVHLSNAVGKVAAWPTPMRLNDTTRAYFERLAMVSTPEEAARYNGLVNPEKTEAIQEYFAEHEPGSYSMLRTSISPTVIKGGYRVNVIPSEAEATLDVRALPDEDMGKFIEMMKKIINDPAVEIVREARDTRPGAAPSKLDTEAFKVLEAASKRNYPGVPVLPTMQTGATDMSYLRARGLQCYGLGPATDIEDGPKGFGAHSDQERVLESELYRFIRFHFDIVRDLAAAR